MLLRAGSSVLPCHPPAHALHCGGRWDPLLLLWQVLEAFPTSAEEDERLLAELDARLAAGGGASLSTGGSSSAPGGAIIMVGGGGQSGVVLRGAAEHRRRALGFRLARKRLLAAAVEGLQAQAALLRFAAPPDRC